MLNSDGPRRDGLQSSILALKQNPDGLDTLADNGDELPSFTDIFSRARPKVPRVTPPVVDLITDPSDNVSLSHKLPSIVGANCVRLQTTRLFPLSLHVSSARPAKLEHGVARSRQVNVIDYRSTA
jgi:hypothetical protein